MDMNNMNKSFECVHKKRTASYNELAYKLNKQNTMLLDACKDALKAHRRMEFLTCPRVCWCWILEDAINSVEDNNNIWRFELPEETK